MNGLLALLLVGSGAVPAERFRAANDLVRQGDLLGATSAYRSLAASGVEGPSLYWNWAQAASSRGARGEALFAVLRARELDPGDSATEREVERARSAAGLEPAEISPEPLANAARAGRRFHLGLLAVLCSALSLLARVVRGWRATIPLALGLAGLAAAALPLAGAFARPTAVVVTRGATLLDSASPGARPLGALREGEVLPILASTEGWSRIEDSSGARGWVKTQDAWRLDTPPPAP